MNELKQQQATLIAEREALQNRLPQLEADWRNAPTDFSSAGNVIGSPESRAAEDRLSNAESRVRVISSELERIVAAVRKLTQVFNCSCSIFEQENTG